jgi:hypothetical protein
MNANIRNFISDRLPTEIRFPSITTWNRLEPRPRADNFERALRAEVRDALWMLTRQWQFGEFKADDAGSAIFAKIKLETTQLSRYAQRGGQAVAYDGSLPLEARVEREPIPIDLALRIQLGQHWVRLLKHHSQTALIPAYRAAYPIDPPGPADAAHAIERTNAEALQLRALAAGRAIDGGQLLDDLVAGVIRVVGTPAAIVDEFVDRYGRLFVQPQSADDSAWSPEHLEYQFECSAPAANGNQTVLVADEYHQGHLDWYSFDIDPTRDRLADKAAEVIVDPPIEQQTLTFIPTPARFAGMPNVRWWEFEDSHTDFGDIKPSTTELSKLLLAEFGLIYGNDWSVVPYAVRAGSLCEIKGLAVTDVFGQRTLIQAAGRGFDSVEERWNMFNLNTRGTNARADTRLFLPPAVARSLDSAPIEKITFLRDEMANMVWAVESLIPDEVGSGMDGFEAALRLFNYLKTFAADQPLPAPTEALIRFILENSVPENWIPFTPVHVPGSQREIELQRANMLRAVPGLTPVPVKPRGAILRPKPGKYFIHEEEIPRAGAIVTRAYQRVRWLDGKIYLWLGRRKQNGRGEGSSGLKFDQIAPIEQPKVP